MGRNLDLKNYNFFQSEQTGHSIQVLNGIYYSTKQLLILIFLICLPPHYFLQ